MHNFRAFKIGNATYSTGVNDTLLTANGVTFIPQIFEALPISQMGNGGVIGVGFAYGGQGNVAPVPVANNPVYYLTDGVKGLDLGTGIFNARGNNVYSVISINPVAIGDGIPDIIIPQIGDINYTMDRFYFTDNVGTIVGTPLNVDIRNIPPVANALWKFYSRANLPVYGVEVSGNRIIRMAAYDFSALGITTTNYASISYFVHQLSGSSDQPFVAYNKTSVVILPVEWASFDAQKVNNEVDLDWQTSSELNNAYFVVEKSINGTDWKEIDRVQTKSENGNSNRLLQYETKDAQPFHGNNYYRIKQVDVNGDFNYSEMKSVNFERTSIEIFPNPVIDWFEIQGLQSESIVELYGINGIKLASSKIENTTFYRYDASSLPTGIFIVNIISATSQERSQFKVIKN